MADIAYVGYSSGSTGNGTSFAVAAPAGIADGDILVILTWQYTGTGYPGPGAGWTLLAAWSANHCSVWYKKTTGTETITVTNTQKNAGQALCLAYRPGSALSSNYVDAYNVGAQTGSGVGFTAYTVNTTIAKDMYIILTSVAAGSATCTFSSGTPRGSLIGASTPNSMFSCEKLCGNAGANPSPAINVTPSANHTTFTLALNGTSVSVSVNGGGFLTFF